MNDDNKIKELEQSLLVEKTKVKVLSEIIEKNFNIKISSIINELSGSLHNSPHNSPRRTPTCKKETALIKENHEKFLSEDFKSIEKNINDIYTELSQTRRYIKLINNLKILRLKLLGKIGIGEYTTFLHNYIDKIHTIFMEKGMNIEKINKTILKNNLNNIEKRLVQFPGFCDNIIESEEIECYQIILNYYASQLKINKNTLLENLCTYEIALFPIKDIIKKYTLNYYVYIPSNKSNKVKDPHSFYYLDKEGEDNKNHWELDCRLHELTETVSENIKVYCIDLFRKMYNGIFHDNNYRKNYESLIPNFVYDFKQLLQNVIIISNLKTCNEFLKGIIIETVYTPTEDDKLGIKKDDNFIRRQYQKITPEDIKADHYHLIGTLFDNISLEEKTEMYNIILTYY